MPLVPDTAREPGAKLGRRTFLGGLVSAVVAPKLAPPQLVSVDVESRIGHVTISLSDTCGKHVPLFFELVPKDLNATRLDPNWKHHAGRI